MAFYRGKRDEWSSDADRMRGHAPPRQPVSADSELFADFEQPHTAAKSTEAEILDLCRSLRHACAAMEARLDRQDYAETPLPHRAKPRPVAREPEVASRQIGAREAVPPARSDISMREMTGFLLSREGDHFLNLMRRMIREEMVALKDKPVPEPTRRAPLGNTAGDMAWRDEAGDENLRASRQAAPERTQASLRDILRGQSTVQSSARRRSGF